jgi:hypothetical protein
MTRTLRKKAENTEEEEGEDRSERREGKGKFKE